MSRLVKIAALAAASIAIAPAALAEEPTFASVTVSYSDLDLSSPAGVQTLLQRISAASQIVCGTYTMTVRDGKLKRYLACRQTAMKNAIERVNNSAVTMALSSKAGAAISVVPR